VPGAVPAEGRWYSAIGLHTLWNAGKEADPGLAWWGQNSKCACQEVRPRVRPGPPPGNRRLQHERQ